MYPVTLQYSLIRYSSFLVASVRFSMYSIMSSANSDNLLPLSNLDSFISFPSLNTVGKTFKTLLNNSVESWQTFLVPDLSGNGFRFSPLRMMLSVTLNK